MSITQTISIGDIGIMLGLISTILYNYFAVVRRLDRVVMRHDNLETRFEEARRGRGLVLEHWPRSVQRCFGFHNGP